MTVLAHTVGKLLLTAVVVCAAAFCDIRLIPLWLRILASPFQQEVRTSTHTGAYMCLRRESRGISGVRAARDMRGRSMFAEVGGRVHEATDQEYMEVQRLRDRSRTVRDASY